MSLREEELGRHLVAEGRVLDLRQRLGLTRSAMAELLHTTNRVYGAWEDNPFTRLWPATASRLGRFYTNAVAELDYVEQELGVDMSTLVPLYLAAMELGLPQDLLLKRYREGKVKAVDLGILGLWVHRHVLDGMRR